MLGTYLAGQLMYSEGKRRETQNTLFFLLLAVVFPNLHYLGTLCCPLPAAPLSLVD